MTFTRAPDGGLSTSERRLTDFPHPHPQLRGLQKEVLRYQRADGVDLTATLYLPPGHDPARDGPLPTLLWAYPREFKSKEAAGQMRRSPHQFSAIGSQSAVRLLTASPGLAAAWLLCLVAAAGWGGGWSSAAGRFKQTANAHAHRRPIPPPPHTHHTLRPSFLSRTQSRSQSNNNQLLWLARGYAVLDGPTFPIVAEGDDEPNDTYVEQLTAAGERARARLSAAERGCG